MSMFQDIILVDNNDRAHPFIPDHRRVWHDAAVAAMRRAEGHFVLSLDVFRALGDRARAEVTPDGRNDSKHLDIRQQLRLPYPVCWFEIKNDRVETLDYTKLGFVAEQTGNPWSLKLYTFEHKREAPYPHAVSIQMTLKTKEPATSGVLAVERASWLQTEDDSTGLNNFDLMSTLIVFMNRKLGPLTFQYVGPTGLPDAGTTPETDLVKVVGGDHGRKRPFYRIGYAPGQTLKVIEAGRPQP